MNTSIIADARKFMTGKALTCKGEICASCGLARAEKKISKAMNSTFNQTEFFIFDSTFICEKCLQVFQNKDSRSKILYWSKPDYLTLMERGQVLPFLKNPPKAPFVLSVPYSFQKHHWFQAGLSIYPHLYIGTEIRAVHLDYSSWDIAGIIDRIKDALDAGIPRSQLESGNYTTTTRAKFFTRIMELELEIAPLRLTGGAIQLFVRYSPPADKKNVAISEEGRKVFSISEQDAIKVLVALAQASNFRRTQGIAFWQGFFKRRVSRYAQDDLHTFYSKVARDVSALPFDLNTKLLESYTPEQAAGIMKEIRAKTDLLVAACYTEFKGGKDEVKEQKTRNKKEQKQYDSPTLF